MSSHLEPFFHRELARLRAEELARKGAAHRELSGRPATGRVRKPVAAGLRAAANRLWPEPGTATGSNAQRLGRQAGR